MARLKETGHSAAPLSDRFSTFGFTRWTELAKKAELKPIYGVELAVVGSLGQKRPATNYWTFFAIDALRPLHDLIYKATVNPGSEPSLLLKQALEAQGVVKIAGPRLVLADLPAGSEGAFYLALTPSTPVGLVRRSTERNIPLIASSDNLFPRAEDEEFYRVTLGRRASTQTYPQYILSDAEWLEATAHIASPEQQAEALSNRDKVIAQCNVTMKVGKLLVPEKPATLREMCIRGAEIKGCDLTDPVYAERLDRELNLIAEKEFEDYFYILADLMGYARKKMVCGPARGSSSGSLVCYLLDITTIDPIPHGLIFERFVDANRLDLPDVDADFDDTQRHLVFKYAEERYGKERVARLGTVGMFKARSAIKQAGASLRIPGWRTDKVMDSIIERSSGDSRAGNTLEDTLNETDAGRALFKEYPELMIAARMEGHPNVASQHAAGIIITDEPVAEYVATDFRTGAAWVDKKDAETLNLLKVDALGLTQLSVFARTLELIGEDQTAAFLDNLPLDDPASFAVLNEGKYNGIFQFTGTAVRSLAGQVTFSEFSDLVAMTALARPGPLGSGGASAWIRRKKGEELPEAIHPLLTELTKETFGVVIYQETVMQICREVGDFSWADTAKIRRLMSKSMGKEFFDTFWQKFKVGAANHGLSEDAASAVWSQINTMGAWSFNKSHAVAYGMVSYWCCWLKAHHPVAFAAATLDAEDDPAKQIAMLRELAAEGVEYTPIDPLRSTARWTPSADGKRLIGPLTTIKGIGPAKVKEILDSRTSGKPLRPALMKQLENAQTSISSLYPISDRVKALHPDLSAVNIITRPTPLVEAQPGLMGRVVIIGLIKKISPRDENEAINVKKRNGRVLTGPTASLNLWMQDDTDEIYVKIDRFAFERIGRRIVEEGVAGKTLLALSGTIPRDFRMLKCENVRWLGEME